MSNKCNQHFTMPSAQDVVNEVNFWTMIDYSAATLSCAVFRDVSEKRVCVGHHIQYLS